MDAFITRRGGTPLNFKIVGGTTRPVNPKENTLWVNTSKAIKGWRFSAEAPQTPQEGMVWIETATTSPNGFDALEKNALYVYPQTVSQYIAGTWTELSAMMYRDGAWMELWNGYLYRCGNQYTDVTGGWALEKWKYTAATNSTLGSITFDDQQIIMSTSGMSNDTGCALTTANKVDLTDYDTLTFKGSFYAYKSYSSSYLRAFIMDDKTQPYHGTPAYKAVPSVGTTYTELSVDISGITGAYYVGIGMYKSSGESISVTVDEVFLW